MDHSVDNTLAVANQTLTRMQAIVTLSEQAKTDPEVQQKFISAYIIVSDLYRDLQDLNKKTPVASTSEAWKELCSLLSDIDMLMIDIDSAYQTVKPSGQSLKSERHSSADLRGSRESIKSVHSVRSGESVRAHSVRSSESVRASEVKLPRINLPEFDGDLKKWPTFYDLFKTLIHDNPTISSVAKFQYLITTLSKEPQALVRHLPLTSANYSIAFDTLVRRYENPRVLATFYWKTVANSPKVQSTSPKALRDLLNIFNENVTALKQINSIDYWDFTLFNWMLQKIDDATRERFEIQFAKRSFPPLLI